MFLMRLMDSAQRSRAAILLLAIATTLILLIPAGAVAVKPPQTVDIQILDISDWHGQLEPISIAGLAGGVPLGGAAALSTYFTMERANYAHTLTLTAGDDVGATPPLSSFFADTPAILAERLMGIQVGTFGNHNFDAGLGRLQSQIDLARAKSGTVGTPFNYVSANLANRDDNLRYVEDYKLFHFGLAVVAVIGITNEEAPTLVFPGNFGTMVPTDSVAAAMAAKADAAANGANVFVAITHKGITGAGPSGELIDFANGVSGFDLIVGDHTDVQFSGTINGQFVIENRSKGATYSKTVLTFNRSTGDVAVSDHSFVFPIASVVTPDPAVAAMLAPYSAQLAPIFSTVIGESDVRIPRDDLCGGATGRTCESLIGDVVTDSMRLTYGTDFAFTNAGGIRDNLTCDSGYATGFCPTYTPPPWKITRGETQAVLPFGNFVVTFSLNGAELKAILENGVSLMPTVAGRFPQVSGLCFTYDITAPVGSRITSAVRQAADGSCTGAAVDLTSASTYTLAENDFMASGGESSPNFTSRMVSRDIMVNVLSDWVIENTPLSPDPQGRISCVRIFNPLSTSVCPAPI
jgi:2',3'-cyclic-nucleotide 2'-phosphodiesterase (5'-nucleotidase family)